MPNGESSTFARHVVALVAVDDDLEKRPRRLMRMRISAKAGRKQGRKEGREGGVQCGRSLSRFAVQRESIPLSLIGLVLLLRSLPIRLPLLPPPHSLCVLTERFSRLLSRNIIIIILPAAPSARRPRPSPSSSSNTMEQNKKMTEVRRTTTAQGRRNVASPKPLLLNPFIPSRQKMDGRARVPVLQSVIHSIQKIRSFHSAAAPLRCG